MEDRPTSIKPKQLVSVVIPAKNAVSFIGEAIQSAFDQGRIVREVIVVDDHSDDGLKEYLVNNYPTVIYLQSHGYGVSAARNTGVRSSRNDYIAFLDADDIWLLNKLAEQIKCLKPNSIIATKMVNFRSDENGVKHFQPTQAPQYIQNNIFDHMIGAFGCVTPTWLMSKQLYDRMGGFNEQLQKGEDLEFIVRLQLQGGTLEFIEKVYLHRRLHGKNMHAGDYFSGFTTYCNIAKMYPTILKNSTTQPHPQPALFWYAIWLRFTTKAWVELFTASFSKKPRSIQLLIRTTRILVEHPSIILGSWIFAYKLCTKPTTFFRYLTKYIKESSYFIGVSKIQNNRSVLK